MCNGVKCLKVCVLEFFHCWYTMSSVEPYFLIYYMCMRLALGRILNFFVSFWDRIVCIAFILEITLLKPRSFFSSFTLTSILCLAVRRSCSLRQPQYCLPITVTLHYSCSAV